MNFEAMNTVEEIKALYRRLAMKNHPDRGGDTATMQDINRQYQIALKRCDGKTSTGTDGKEHKYTYNEETEAQIMEKISELLALNMDAEIMLIGVWIWVEGETKPHKDALKGIGCKWHSKRAAWFWHKKEDRAYRRSNGDLAELAEKYGYKKFEKGNSKRLAA